MLTFEFQRIDDISDRYLYSAAGFAAGKRCATTPLATSFGATLLLHSEALKKTLFLQLVDQTLIEKLFYGSVCYRATYPLSDHVHADAQPFPANDPGWKSEHAAKIVIGIVLDLSILFIEPLAVGRDAELFIIVKLIHRFAVGFHKAFHRLTVFFEERAPYGEDALGKSFNVGEIDENIQPSLGGFKGLRRRKRAGIYAALHHGGQSI